jgi:hypothetical protein
MAACLGCGYQRARVTYSRTVRTEGKRECWRITICPEPTGERNGEGELSPCGSRRRQTVRDDGPTRERWIEPQGGRESESAAKCMPPTRAA